jgi:hypothetical protein
MGCPSIIDFEKSSDMKATIIKKGNQATSKMFPDIVKKTINKEDRNSHLLPVKLWVLHFFALLLSYGPRNFSQAWKESLRHL